MCRALISGWKPTSSDLEGPSAPKDSAEKIVYKCDSTGQSSSLDAVLNQNAVETGGSSKPACTDVVDMALVPMSADQQQILGTCASSRSLTSRNGQEPADSPFSIMDADCFNYGGSFVIAALDDDIQDVTEASVGTGNSIEVAADTGGIEEHQNRQKMKQIYMAEVIEHQDAVIANLTAKCQELEEEASLLRAQLLCRNVSEAEDRHVDQAPSKSVLPDDVSSSLEDEDANPMLLQNGSMKANARRFSSGSTGGAPTGPVAHENCRRAHPASPKLGRKSCGSQDHPLSGNTGTATPTSRTNTPSKMPTSRPKARSNVFVGLSSMSISSNVSESSASSSKPRSMNLPTGARPSSPRRSASNFAAKSQKAEVATCCLGTQPSASLSEAKVNCSIQPEAWKNEEVSAFLEDFNLGSFIDVFMEKGITGKGLLSLTESMLDSSFGMRKLWQRQRLMQGIRRIRAGKPWTTIPWQDRSKRKSAAIVSPERNTVGGRSQTQLSQQVEEAPSPQTSCSPARSAPPCLTPRDRLLAEPASAGGSCQLSAGNNASVERKQEIWPARPRTCSPLPTRVGGRLTSTQVFHSPEEKQEQEDNCLLNHSVCLSSYLLGQI